MNKYDNDFKIKVIELGLVKEVAQKKRDYYLHDKHYTINDYGVIDQVFCPSWEIWKKENKQTPSIDCALKLIESKYRKAKRIRDKITRMVNNENAIFITLTFTDEVLANTSHITRRRYVARYLKEQSPFYVANVDYSPNKNREHYHAVVNNRCDLNKWTFGHSYAEKIKTDRENALKTSRYVAKLTSHALKVYGSTPRLIYSRDTI